MGTAFLSTSRPICTIGSGLCSLLTPRRLRPAPARLGVLVVDLPVVVGDVVVDARGVAAGEARGVRRDGRRHAAPRAGELGERAVEVVLGEVRREEVALRPAQVGELGARRQQPPHHHQPHGLRQAVGGPAAGGRALVVEGGLHAEGVVDGQRHAAAGLPPRARVALVHPLRGVDGDRHRRRPRGLLRRELGCPGLEVGHRVGVLGLELVEVAHGLHGALADPAALAPALADRQVHPAARPLGLFQEHARKPPLTCVYPCPNYSRHNMP